MVEDNSENATVVEINREYELNYDVTSSGSVNIADGYFVLDMKHTESGVQYETIDDNEAVDAFFKLSRYEGVIPALESAHAVAYAMKWAKENRCGSILATCSGRGDKDLDYVIENFGFGEDHQF